MMVGNVPVGSNAPTKIQKVSLGCGESKTLHVEDPPATFAQKKSVGHIPYLTILAHRATVFDK